MKTSFFATAFAVTCAALLSTSSPAQAQGNAREAADMLRALNIQIGDAQRAGDRQRVSQLQNRYLDIQKKWGVSPSPAPGKPRPLPVPPPPPPTNYFSTQGGSGKVTGYRGGPIRVRRVSVTLPNFYSYDRTPNDSGRGAVLKFTSEDGVVFTYTGNWSYRGNRSVSLRVNDGEGGTYTGNLAMEQSGVATVNLVGNGTAEGYNVTFAN